MSSAARALDNKGTIQKIPTILGINTIGEKIEYKKGDFYGVKVYQYSKTNRFQSRAQSATFRYREYRVSLVSEYDSLKIISFMDYKKARNTAIKIAKTWNYELNDVIQKKMLANKKEREERLKNRR